jgi:Mg2+ and Co2+ transporter CorA
LTAARTGNRVAEMPATRSKRSSRPGRAQDEQRDGRDAPAGHSADEPSRLRRSVPAHVFDANGSDRETDLTEESVPKLDDEVLLWTELNGEDVDVSVVAELLKLPDDLVSRLRTGELAPSLVDYEECLHVRVVDLTNGEALVPVAVDAVAGRNWLLTIHRGDGTQSESFRAAFRGETELGRLDSLSFLAALLETQVGSYFAAILAVEEQIEAFDTDVLRSKLADGEDALARLVALRSQLALIRRHLVRHRDTYSTLGDADLTMLGSEDSARRFQNLLGRLERAVDAAESARQMVAGSFEILMTKTGQRTNDIMKLLTLVSAALLPSSVIAGVLGMNFKQPFFDLSFLFWVVVALMVALMVGAITIARRRRWL